MAKDHKTFDGYLIEDRWDGPGQMANLAKKKLTGKVKVAYMA